MNPVGHERTEGEISEVGAHHLREPVARRRNEPPAHRALARARAEAWERWLDRPNVLPCRDAEHQLLDASRRQRVRFREALSFVERQLGAVDAPDARSTSSNTSSAHRQFSVRVARSTPTYALALTVTIVSREWS